MHFMCSKSCLVDIRLLHFDLMVAGPKVQLGKEHILSQLIQELLSNWNRKLILNGQLVKLPIIHI